MTYNDEEGERQSNRTEEDAIFAPIFPVYVANP